MDFKPQTRQDIAEGRLSRIRGITFTTFVPVGCGLPYSHPALEAQKSGYVKAGGQ
jgi:hypothetical protein